MMDPAAASPKLTVLCIDPQIVVVRKPANLSTQCPPGGESLESRVRRQVAADGEYLAPVHRLDRLTEGIVLFARTKKAARLLSEQFAARRVQKIYHAEVHDGGWSANVCPTIWTDYLVKVAGQPRVQLCEAETVGAKRCQCEVFLEQRIPSSRRLRLRLEPQTGRMHQLRIQCASRNFPIVGDPLYGAGSEATTNLSSAADSGSDQAKNSGPMMLRATGLTFYHPRTGEPVVIDDQKVATDRQ